MRISLAAMFAALAVAQADAASISLSSSIDRDSFISETQGTGALAFVGASPNALYPSGPTGQPSDNTVNGGPQTADNPGFNFGSQIVNGQFVTGFQIFNADPAAPMFQIGSLEFDSASVTGFGTEVVTIDSVDASAFFGLGTPNADILIDQFALWFFGGLGSNASFDDSGLDADDTLTFVDGLLTSIDLTLPGTFRVDASAFDNQAFGEASGDVGELVISGSDLSIDFSGQRPVFGGTSNFTVDIDGTVGAVNSFQIVPIPEPTTLVMLGIGGLGAVVARRRNAAAA